MFQTLHEYIVMSKICYSLDEREKYLKDELESVTEEASKYF